MEVVGSPQGQKQNLGSVRKCSSNRSSKEIWLVVREGSLADVDLALALIKKNGGNINSRNIFGLTPLHIATWRNHIPIVKRLLAAGADPDARDGESGWSSLHRALHFGHLAVASILLQSGASMTLEDSKSRTPIDLLSGPLLQVVGSGTESVATEVFSWGNGANYQLGTGNEHVSKLPCKVDTLHGSFIKLVSAAKFHSVAVTARGEVYTWGFGRGGRLGHPDFDIHSGQAAVITPRQVTTGLGSRRVKAIAAAKHHTVIATEGGDVFTWGSNREGQLGYTSVDTQPTPRRVSSLKSKIIAVAAANKHSAVVSESGEVFTWGCNKEGQLGYGTSNSASNYTPRVVEYLKGKVFIGVAAAKYHTLVLGADGEVYTWGHRLVTPKRVVVGRNLKKSGTSLLKFHRMDRLHVVGIAAGMVHSMARTEDGALFYWVSSDPDLRCRQLYTFSEQNVVSISAGKHWASAVTSTGDVYTWDGKKGKDKPPVPTRLHGIKRASSVSTGETHLLIIGSLYHPLYPGNISKIPQKPLSNVTADEPDELTEDLIFGDMDSSNYVTAPTEKDDKIEMRPVVPSLKSLCEKVAAEWLVEPRNSVQLLEVADSLGADDLRKHCEDIAIRNLDYILSVASHAVSSASLDILADLEKLLDLRSSEPWCYRRLPTPTATFPAIINSEEEDSEPDVLRTRESLILKGSSSMWIVNERDQRSESFLLPKDDQNEAISKQVRSLRKKLQQIEVLEAKQSTGHLLDGQQIAKLQTRPVLESSLAELGAPIETSMQQGNSDPNSPNAKSGKKSQVLRKHRKKSKYNKLDSLDGMSTVSGTEIEQNLAKDFLQVEGCEVGPKNKEEDGKSEEIKDNETVRDSASFLQKSTSELTKNKTSVSAASKKKNRKGGLSMFLSGALDDNPVPKDAPPPPPPSPKTEGPAWGGAKIPKGFSSLREIQDEQSKITFNNQPSKTNDQLEDVSDTRNEAKIQLSSFLPSKPIPVVSARSPQVSEGEKSTPWAAASGTPPALPSSRLSLRDIQMQQKGKQQQGISSNSPKTRTAGFSIPTSQGSPSDSTPVSRWFKPEADAPSSLRSIQIEEKAIKDLKRFYSSVKIVKNQS